MQKSVNRNNEYLKPIERIYHHYFQLEKGITHEKAQEIINSFDTIYAYNPNIGILMTETTIPKKVNDVNKTILNIPIFLGIGLTKEELHKFDIDVCFAYDIKTGILSCVHNIKCTQ